jgi:hypothetical protein
MKITTITSKQLIRVYIYIYARTVSNLYVPFQKHEKLLNLNLVRGGGF